MVTKEIKEKFGVRDKLAPIFYSQTPKKKMKKGILLKFQLSEMSTQINLRIIQI